MGGQQSIDDTSSEKSRKSTKSSKSTQRAKQMYLIRQQQQENSNYSANKQQEQIHYKRMLIFLNKKSHIFQFYYSEFSNYFEFGDLSKQVNMKKVAWMNIHINDVIKQNHVKCNMKVKLLKDFFQGEDRKKKFRNRHDSNNSNDSSRKSMQNVSHEKQKLINQIHQLNIKQLQEKEKIQKQKSFNRINSSGSQSTIGNVDESLLMSANIREKERETITLNRSQNSKLKLQIAELSRFLQSEALLYDHIFQDISVLFSELFFQKYDKQKNLGDDEDDNTDESQQGNNDQQDNNNNVEQQNNNNKQQQQFECNNLEHTAGYKNMINILLQPQEFDQKSKLKQQQKAQKQELKEWEEMLQDIAIFVQIIEEFLIISYTTFSDLQRKNLKQMKQLNQEQLSQQEQQYYVCLLNENMCLLRSNFFKQNSYLNTSILKSFCIRNSDIMNTVLESVCESSIDNTYKLSQIYNQLRDITPQSLGIDKELCLPELEYPYQECMDILSEMNETPDPVKVLDDIVRLKEEICNCIYEYQIQRKAETFTVNIDGDELIMLFCFVLIKANISELYNIFEITDSLTEKQQEECGESAYCFSMIQSAQNYIISLSSQPQQIKKILDYNNNLKDIKEDKVQIEEVRQNLYKPQKQNLIDIDEIQV